MWTRWNYLCFYPHKAYSIFLPPLFVFHTKFEFSLEFTQRWLVKKALMYSNAPCWLSPLPHSSRLPLPYIIKRVKYNKTQFWYFLHCILHQFPPSLLSPCCCHRLVSVIEGVLETFHGIIPFLLVNASHHGYGICQPIYLLHPQLWIPTGCVLRVHMGQGKVMDGFGVRRGRVFPQVQDGEE